ncbi:DUF1501 domain-containing protein, partial [Aquitalea pelogenes]|uniref:DUF1501 domain-containing protein n=1 Tax=Aquitalea pelogenes TaxID=1293573 RepID=UPI00195C8659
MSYAEFGRRPRENGNRGTDHGTANSHFLLGGRVKGGLYGQTAPLARADRWQPALRHRLPPAVQHRGARLVGERRHQPVRPA